MTDIVERLRDLADVTKSHPYNWEGTRRLVGEAADEIERLRAMVLDACEVFDFYELPQQSFHYRRAILGLEEAKKIARGA